MSSKILFIGVSFVFLSFSAFAGVPTQKQQSVKYTKYGDGLYIGHVYKDHEKSKIKKNVSQVYLNAGLQETGKRPQKVGLTGWAKSMPLSIAVRQIIPPSFSIINHSQSVYKTKSDHPVMVSWKGNLPWPQTLDRMAEDNNFLAKINWIKREVSIYPVKERKVYHIVKSKPINHSPVKQNDIKSQKTVELAKKESKKDTREYFVKEDGYFTPAKHPIKKKVPVIPKVKVWTLDPKLTLRENVEKWAKKAGWKVVWTGADYPIVASAKFTGKFTSPTGPLAKLIEAYSDSDQPLIARLTTKDKVVYVKNKYHQRVQVSPTYPSDINKHM